MQLTAVNRNVLEAIKLKFTKVNWKEGGIVDRESITSDVKVEPSVFEDGEDGRVIKHNFSENRMKPFCRIVKSIG